MESASLRHAAGDQGNALSTEGAKPVCCNKSAAGHKISRSVRHTRRHKAGHNGSRYI